MTPRKTAVAAGSLLAATAVAIGALTLAGNGSSASADLFISPAGNDANACTQTAPCKTFPHAFAVASGGAVVEAADGFYGCGSISGSKSSDVTFRAAPGAVPWITCPLSVSAQHVAFDSINIARLDLSQPALVNTLNVNVTCKDSAPFALFGGRCSAGVFGTPAVLNMVGGSVGPTVEGNSSRGNSQIGIPYNGGPNVSSFNFDGVRFHDNRRNASTEHTECLMIGGGNPVTITNSSFENCAVFDVFVTWWNFVSPQYAVASNLKFQRNTFNTVVAGCPGCDVGFFSLYFADYPTQWTNVDVSYNTFRQSFHAGSAKHVGWTVSHNQGVQLSYDCASDVTYTANLWDGGVKCGTTDNMIGAGPGTTTTPTTTATVPTTTAATTTAPTTTAVTTTTPTTTAQTPPPYKPACAITCDEQIATLQSKVDNLNAQLAAANTNASLSAAQIASLQTQVAALNARIAAAVAALAP